MSWDDYSISRNRYNELKAFCLQYQEKKSKINRNSIQEEPRKAAYLNDCRIIEEAAIKAAPMIWKYIVRSVTQGISYEHIEYDEELGKIPYGQTEFYAYRRLFYHYLDHMKLG